MGRAVVFLIIAGVAGLMAWFALKPECAVATIASEEACAALPGMSAAACGAAFAKARRQATLYPDLLACQNDGFDVCDLHASLTGFTPRPEKFCVAASDGAAIAMPIYRKRGQNLR